MSTVSRFLFIVFVAALLVPLPAQAQGIGGSIGGVVKDESGAPVAAAVVKLTNSQTAQTRSVSTDDAGRYQIREVPPGNYDLTVERPGFNTAKAEKIRVSVAQAARLDDISLSVATIGEEREVPVTVNIFLTDISSPTLSTSFSDKQIQDLPILTRDVNNLALLAPGVFSVRTFSFASTLVPFAANGSRGRDNNFIIDSVDNNEPLFGGAATQFTNTDLFAEYRILTNQYKAEYGRNSGSVVNIITERGGNQWRGSLFAFGQHDRFNAANRVENNAGLGGTTRFYETQPGATLGGPLKQNHAWVFFSYQWDRARSDLTPTYPLIVTLPTTAGQTFLRNTYPNSRSVQSLLGVPTVANLPGANAPCGAPGSNLPATNPCTIGSAASVFLGTADTPFGTFLVPRAGVFDVRDHQLSGRYDQKVSERDDIYVRYLFDDLRTPRTGGGAPGEVAFSDLGLMPESRAFLRQRTQSLGIFWTRAWATALHELRVSSTRISSQTGAFNESKVNRESRPAAYVFDSFAQGVNQTGTTGAPATCPPSMAMTDAACRADATFRLLSAFPAAGLQFTVGRDSKPTKVNSNIFQLQDNFSWSRGPHGLKIGGNLVRTQTNVRQIPSDLGQYLFFTFGDFVADFPLLAFQRFANFQGRGGDVLPVREFSKFFFFQDDIRVNSRFTLSLGIRYENYGQALNKVAELNPGFGPRVDRDDNNFGPRIGFAWSPGSSGKWVFRGGYGMYFNPTVFNIALITWQGGRVSPFVVGVPSCLFNSPTCYPTNAPFTRQDAAATNNPLINPFGCDISAPRIVVNQFLSGEPGVSYTDCTSADTVATDLTNPYVHNYSLNLQRTLGSNLLFEISYVGSRGASLFQRLDRNPQGGWSLVNTAVCTSFPNGINPFDNPGGPTARPPCLIPRGDASRGQITQVGNRGKSNYHAMQVSMTHRFSQRIPLAITGAYTWSHMIDTASEIFGPGVRRLGNLTPCSGFFGNGNFSGGDNCVASFTPVEAITPFPQDPNNPINGERGNSSFDRRHRLAISVLYLLPSPDGGFARFAFGGWQVNSLFTAQSGQPFTPINSFGSCVDSNGDGILTNDRPLAGNPRAPADSVAVLINCADPTQGYRRPGSARVDFATQADALQNSRFVQAPLNVLGNVGRNTLRGPNTINMDLGVFKNFPWGERRNLQFRVEAYNLFNRANPGNLIGNVFASDAQPVPAIAFGPVSPSATPARVVGVIPENSIDAVDAVTNTPLFLSRRFMNTGSRRLQFGVKLIF
jgi:hypothetical protein